VRSVFCASSNPNDKFTSIDELFWDTLPTLSVSRSSMPIPELNLSRPRNSYIYELYSGATFVSLARKTRIIVGQLEKNVYEFWLIVRKLLTSLQDLVEENKSHNYSHASQIKKLISSFQIINNRLRSKLHSCNVIDEMGRRI